MQDLLSQPGPYVLGCGLHEGSREHATFDAASRVLWGQLAFAAAGPSLCADLLKLPTAALSQIVWSRASDGPLGDCSSGGCDGKRGGPTRIATGEVLENATEVVAWLRSHRAEVLEEMTPDNSHVYFGRSAPLALLLLDPDSQTQGSAGLELFAEVEHKLPMDSFQLAWSDCRLFGAQFEAEAECPALVLFNTRTAEWRKTPMSSILAPPARRAGGAATKANYGIIYYNTISYHII